MTVTDRFDVTWGFLPDPRIEIAEVLENRSRFFNKSDFFPVRSWLFQSRFAKFVILVDLIQFLVIIIGDHVINAFFDDVLKYEIDFVSISFLTEGVLEEMTFTMLFYWLPEISGKMLLSFIVTFADFLACKGRWSRPCLPRYLFVDVRWSPFRVEPQPLRFSQAKKIWDRIKPYMKNPRDLRGKWIILSPNILRTYNLRLKGSDCVTPRIFISNDNWRHFLKRIGHFLRNSYP